MASSAPFFYQAKSGHIYLGFGNCRTQLSRQQVEEIGVNVYGLDDFDIDDYRRAYAIAPK